VGVAARHAGGADGVRAHRTVDDGRVGEHDAAAALEGRCDLFPRARSGTRGRGRRESPAGAGGSTLQVHRAGCGAPHLYQVKVFDPMPFFLASFTSTDLFACSSVP